MTKQQKRTIFEYFSKYPNELVIEVLDYMKEATEFSDVISSLGDDYQNPFFWKDYLLFYNQVASYLHQLRINPLSIKQLRENRHKSIFDYFDQEERTVLITILDYMRDTSTVYQAELTTLGPDYQASFSPSEHLSFVAELQSYLIKIKEDPEYLKMFQPKIDCFDEKVCHSKTIFSYFKNTKREELIQVLDYMKKTSKFREQLIALGPNYQEPFFSNFLSLYNVITNHLRHLRKDPDYIKDLNLKFQKKVEKKVYAYLSTWEPQQVIYFYQTVKQTPEQLKTICEQFHFSLSLPSLYDDPCLFLTVVCNYITQRKRNEKGSKEITSTDAITIPLDLSSLFSLPLFSSTEDLLHQLESYDQSSYHLFSLVYEAFLQGVPTLFLTELEYQQFHIAMNQLQELSLRKASYDPELQKTISLSL